jgi:hypothetical protein
VNVGYHIPENSELPVDNGSVSLTAYYKGKEKKTRLNHYF